MKQVPGDPPERVQASPAAELLSFDIETGDQPTPRFEQDLGRENSLKEAIPEAAYQSSSFENHLPSTWAKLRYAL